MSLIVLRYNIDWYSTQLARGISGLEKWQLSMFDFYAPGQIKFEHDAMGSMVKGVLYQFDETDLFTHHIRSRYPTQNHLTINQFYIAPKLEVRLDIGMIWSFDLGSH